MDEQLDSLLDKCRCCLEEITLAKIEIDNIIETKYFEMTQLNLTSSNLLPSFICVDCYEILTSYSTVRSKFIENFQWLEERMQLTQNDDLIEDTCIVYEEISDRNYTSELHEMMDELPVEEIYPEEEEERENKSDSDEELRLEDIVRPDLLHYCLPKKEPEAKRPKRSKDRSKKSDFMCEECGKFFSNPVAVKQHITHTHRKVKFHCDFPSCTRVFNTELHLSKHVAAFHKNSKTVPCEVCNKQFKDEIHLSNHMTVAHPNGVSVDEYKCETCGEHLISYKVYQNHMKKHSELSTTAK